MAHEDDKQVDAPLTENDVHIEEDTSTSETQKAGAKRQHVSIDGSNSQIFEQNKIIQPIQDIDPTTSHEAVSKAQSAGDNVKDYSSFSTREKRFIVFIATIAAVFSPFTAQIYFPALNAIAKDLHVTNSKVNLTVTTYMILQATAPAFIGGFSDTAGRRPAYILCFVIYIIADVALAIQNNYVALLVLRMVQSAGSSGTVALANAVVADVATSAERGIYIGMTSLPAILAPSLGPILGGILSQYAGWKWIFGFLAIFAFVFFILLLLFFPETGRTVVGDGTIPPPRWSWSLMSWLNERRRLREDIQPDHSARDELAKKRGRIRFPNPLGTLIVVTEKEAACILFFAGVVYAGFYAIISGMPSQLKEIYGYSDLVVGLMYLPISGGSLLAAFTQGKIIDWSYHREARRLGIKVVKSRQQDLSNFPIEKARLQVAIPLLFMCALSTIAYGWILHFRTNIAGPCVMLFILGYTLIASTQSVSILMVDINPGLAGTATAAFNLVRCLLGAGATALILPLTNAVGWGWAYTLIAFIYVVMSPLLFLVIKFGPRWRKARMEADEEKEKLKLEKAKEEERVENGGRVRLFEVAR